MIKAFFGSVLYLVTFLWSCSELLSSVSAAECSDPFSCVLDNIYIYLGNATIPINDDGAVLYLTDLYCTDVAIQSFPSSYLAPTSLQFSLDGLHVYCAGDYVYDTGGRISYKGLMEATIKDTNVTMDFYLEKAPDSVFAEAMSIPVCEFLSEVVDVTFTGNKGVDFTALSNAVQTFLTVALKRIVCVKLPDLVSVNGTEALVDTINPALESIIANGPSAVPPLPFEYVSWSDTMLGLMSKMVDTQLAESIHSCVVDIFPAYTAMPWIDVLISAFTNSTGIIEIDVNKTIPVKNGSLALNEITIIGLNSFKTINLIQPSPTSNISLTTTLELDKLEIIMNTTTKSSPAEGWVEHRQFNFAISNVTIVVDLALGINKTHVDSLYFDQFMDHGCMLQSVGYLNITSLVADLTINEISLVQVSGGAAMLEQNLVELVDNAFLLLTDGFGDLVTEVLGGLFQGPVRGSINEKITQSIALSKESATCTAHVPYNTSSTANYVLWYNSSMIQMIDKVVSDAAGMNKFMDCITNHTGSLFIDRDNWSIEVDGLNSFYNLTLLGTYPGASPTNYPYDLLNSIGLGDCPDRTAPSCNPFALKFTAKGSQLETTDGWGSNLYSRATQLLGYEYFAEVDYDEVLTRYAMALLNPVFDGALGTPTLPIIPAGTTIYLSMENFYFFLDLFAKMNKADLQNVQVGQKGTTGCFAQAFNDISIVNMTLAASNVSLNVDDGKKNVDLTKMISTIFGALTRPSRIERTNQKIATELSNAAIACQNGGVVPMTDDNPPSDGDKKSFWQWYMILLIAGCIGALVALASAYYYWGRTGKIRCLRRQKGVDSAPVDEHGKEITDERSFYERWGFQDALICQVKLPRVLRAGIVVAVIGDMICFLMSNLDPNAVLVMAEVDILDTVIKPPPVFAFGLYSTVQDSQCWFDYVCLLALPIYHNLFAVVFF
jgi:hypothetical protein